MFSIFRRKKNPVSPLAVPSPLAVELLFKDREEIRLWLESATTQKVLGLLESRKPTIFIPGTGINVKSEWDERATINQLHRLQGWESYRNTILSLPRAPEEIKQIVESFSEPVNQ